MHARPPVPACDQQGRNWAGSRFGKPATCFVQCGNPALSGAGLRVMRRKRMVRGRCGPDAQRPPGMGPWNRRDAQGAGWGIPPPVFFFNGERGYGEIQFDAGWPFYAPVPAGRSGGPAY